MFWRLADNCSWHWDVSYITAWVWNHGTEEQQEILGMSSSPCFKSKEADAFPFTLRSPYPGLGLGVPLLACQEEMGWVELHSFCFCFDAITPEMEMAPWELQVSRRDRFILRLPISCYTRRFIIRTWCSKGHCDIWILNALSSYLLHCQFIFILLSRHSDSAKHRVSSFNVYLCWPSQMVCAEFWAGPEHSPGREGRVW